MEEVTIKSIFNFENNLVEFADPQIADLCDIANLDIKSSIIFSTSGSLSIPKLVVLSKAGFLSAALSINKLIGTDKNDIWLTALSTKHVGGASILARAFLSESKVYTLTDKWNPLKFIDVLKSKNVTLTSLVPTQVFDLVKNNLSAPISLRQVIIGGGNLSDKLYEEAIALRWPLLKTYGLTESSAAMAVESNGNLKTLDHIECKIDKDLLSIKGESVISGYILKSEGIFNKFIDPKIDSWFRTEDLIKLIFQNPFTFKFLGRENRTVKILGHLVNLDDLQNRINIILSNLVIEKFEYILNLQEHERSGGEIVLFTDNPDLSSELITELLSNEVPYYAIPKKIVYVKEIPRSELGKILYYKLNAND